MSKNIEYLYENHGDFDREWLPHRKISEWWYATGVLKTDQGSRYSYQFTIVRPFIKFFYFHCLMLALTNLETGEHHYFQFPKIFGSGINLGADEVSFSDKAVLLKKGSGLTLKVKVDFFELDLELDYDKGAFWHCDNGILQMGLDAKNEQTTYFSYTNMPTTGSITAAGKTMPVKGKSWFDKQGGPYSLMNRETHWEWFSLRFHDNEEIMLFSFPQTNNYHDGTYITASGKSQRLQDYDLKATKFLESNGMKFSCEWTLFMPDIKDEKYQIKPLVDGQINLAYFELLAGIYDESGKEVGLCFVELLPGVYNHNFQKIGGLLKRKSV